MLPRSTIAPFICAVVGFLIYFWLSGGAEPRDAYVGFALDVFNIVAILVIVAILYSQESKDPTKFGAAIREDISVFQIALLSNFVFGFANIWQRVGKLIF